MALTLRAALVGIAMICLIGPAQANCGGGAFAGPYVGAAVGFGRYDAKQSSPGEITNASGDDNGFVAGVLAGYNIQCTNTVFGIEADINYADFKADSSWPDPVFLTSSIDWFGTVRGRVGLVVRPDTMLYVTGGLAYADVSQHLTTPPPPVAFSQTDSTFKTGWTIGGGVEFLRSERWSLRAEALYVDLGGNSRTYTAACGGCTATADWDDSFWVGRLGLTLKLGHEEKHVPLK
jgi:outer membrane immunogenic protein